VPAPLLVFVGGAVGGLARYAVTSAWPAGAIGFPWATLLVNISGAFALGALLGRDRGHRPHRSTTGTPHNATRLLMGTGFLGAWTTFSALAVSSDRMLAHDRPLAAMAYGAMTVVGGIAAALAGRGLAPRQT
jgi:fluoride exporter